MTTSPCKHCIFTTTPATPKGSLYYHLLRCYAAHRLALAVQVARVQASPRRTLSCPASWAALVWRLSPRTASWGTLPHSSKQLSVGDLGQSTTPLALPAFAPSVTRMHLPVRPQGDDAQDAHGVHMLIIMMILVMRTMLACDAWCRGRW